MEYPSTLPRICPGKELTKIAVFVLNIMAAPIPCITRITKSITIDTAKTAAMQQATNMIKPVTRTVFLHVMSATLPMGTENAATASVYPVTSHPTKLALTPNCSPISGIDKFSALPVNVVMNAVMTTTVIMIFCSVVFFIPVLYHNTDKILLTFITDFLKRFLHFYPDVVRHCSQLGFHLLFNHFVE